MKGSKQECCWQLGQHAHWLLRLSLASVFLYHGLPKFIDLPMVAANLELPVWVAALVALAEVGGSILLLIGGFMKSCVATRIGAALLVPVMVGAIAMVHWGQWSFLPSETHPMGGMEFHVALLAMQLYLVATGGNRCECDCEMCKS